MVDIAVARPGDARVDWQVYIDAVVKVRRLNSGVVEVAVRDEGWVEL